MVIKDIINIMVVALLTVACWIQVESVPRGVKILPLGISTWGLLLRVGSRWNIFHVEPDCFMPRNNLAVNSESLSQKWLISPEVARRTVQHTMQRGKRTILYPSLTRQFKKMTECWGTIGCIKISSPTQYRQVLFPEKVTNMPKFILLSWFVQGRTR